MASSTSAAHASGPRVGAVEAAITQISDSFEEFEHLSTTILPLPYAQLIRLIAFIFLLELPLATVAAVKRRLMLSVPPRLSPRPPPPLSSLPGPSGGEDAAPFHSAPFPSAPFHAAPFSSARFPLPLRPLPSARWGVIPLCLAANLIYFLTDECAAEMEMPFGRDANDVQARGGAGRRRGARGRPIRTRPLPSAPVCSRLLPSAS